MSYDDDWYPPHLDAARAGRSAARRLPRLPLSHRPGLTASWGGAEVTIQDWHAN